MATADRTRRITCDDHSRYTAGCRGCQVRAAARGRARTRGLAYGTWEGMVDAAPARQHVAALTAVGWTGRRIAAASSVARSVVHRLVDGTATQVHTQTLKAILSIPVAPRHPTGHDMVDATGAARRLQALSAIGHAPAKLAAELGVDVQSVLRWRRRRFAMVIATRHQSIAALYDRLATVPGSCERTRADAARNGWVPPLAWDDIDDPNVCPDLGDERPDLIDRVAIERALAGEQVRLTDAERDEAFRVGLARGMTAYNVGHALRLSSSTYQRIAQRVTAELAA